MIELYAPMSGKIIPIEQIPDPVFSGKMMGDGMGIDPSGEVVLSPVDGEVTLVAKTKHAISLTTSEGLEILIHVGVETVALNGQGFNPLVTEGQKVTKGTPLLEFDSMDLVMGGATSLISAILVTNSDQWTIVSRATEDTVEAGEHVLYAVQSEGAETPAESTDGGELVCKEVLVRNPHGLHARPAAQLANAAKQFTSKTEVCFNGKRGNLKSTVSLMGVDIGPNSLITISAVGADSKEAVDTLVALVESGLGEELLPEGESPVPATDDSGKGGKKPCCTEPLSPHTTTTLRGVSASQGFAVGVSYLFEKKEIAIVEEAKTPQEELLSLTAAINQSKVDLEELIARAKKNSEQEKEEIFIAHYTLLSDPEMLEASEERIKEGASAGRGWSDALTHFCSVFEKMDNPLMKERAQDIRDIKDRVLATLYGIDQSISMSSHEPLVLVAEDLTPSEFTEIVDTPNVEIGAICLAQGGPTAHVSILAASQGIPMVVALQGRVLTLENGVECIIDSTKGEVTVYPSSDAYKQASQRVENRKSSWDEMVAAAQDPITTKDGVPVIVAGNASSAKTTASANAMGADQIGLLRTEFVFMSQKSAPSEELQYSFYSEIAAAMEGKPVIFRTLDVGGDKPMPYLPLPKEENPLMGLRGVRNCLSEEARELFRTQIRAILRVTPASARKVMLPMISTLPELREAKNIIEAERQDLGADPIEVGIMIEVPAAALVSDALAAECDFFSIGTNDLTQYIMAMDRTNPLLAPKLNSMHPAVLRLIDIVVRNGKAYNTPTYMCGALASDPSTAPIIVGLGVTELSAVPPAIPEIKEVLSRMTFERCQDLAQQVLKLHTFQEVQDFIYKEL